MKTFRFLLSFFLLVPALSLAIPFAPGAAPAAGIELGKDYIAVNPALPTTTGSDIEVREFFFYGCSHCYAVEMPVVNWLKRKPADVQLVRTPAVLNPKWEPLGRAYYVAEELGILDKTHEALYDAIHVKREALLERDQIAAFFARNGVTKAQFDATYDSFSVSTKVRNADQLARKYMIQGTPTFAVNGRWLVTAGGDRALAVVDFLVAKERAARSKAPKK